MVAFGVAFIILGCIAWIWASNMQNSFEYGWYDFWGSSDYSYVDTIYYMGIIVLIIGVILLVVGCAKSYSNSLKEPENTKDDSEIPQPPKKQCLYCGAFIEKDAHFCTNCGQEQKAQPPLNHKDKYCRNCGNKIGENSAFCSRCGYKAE